MRVLIAEDDPISRRLLEATLKRLDYDVVVTTDGAEAWRTLEGDDGLQLAILDWMMPGLDGPEVCRKVREAARHSYTYLILLTSKGQKADIVAGLESGADDYLVKPFDPQELRSRMRVGQRILRLEHELASKVRELEEALGHVRQLQGLLPICMHCKKIRDDADTWHRMESYIEQHSNAMFTHSLCEDCRREHYPIRRLDRTKAGAAGGD